MNPYDHARSSVVAHGGRWEDYHALHAWFDATKAVRCHYTHRALRHHQEGIGEAIDVFGDVVVNSDGARIGVGDLGRQHLLEDCPFAPVAKDWVVDMATPTWLAGTRRTPEEMAVLSARRYGGSADAYLPLHRWFMATRTWVEGDRHLMFRHHAFGSFEAEARFGPVIAWPGGGVPTRVVAERHIQDMIGRVPTAHDWLRCVKGQRWMLQATSPAKLGLDEATALAA